MSERICLKCGFDMDYLGFKDKMYWFECPNCFERECSKEREDQFVIEVPRLDPRFPLGGKKVYLSSNKIIKC